MSFDFDRAWREATRLMRENRPLLVGIAGVFFFLPYAAYLLALPAVAPLPIAGADLATIAATMETIYTKTWWAILLIAVSLIYGTLAILALLRLRARPTVGEALRLALRALPFYLAAVAIEVLAIDVVLLVINGLARATGLAALAWTAALASLYLQFYAVMRLSMAGPATVLEGERNPVAALRRSWAMTRGVGARLVGFTALIALAFLVVIMVLTLFVGVLLALLGEAAAQIGDAVLSAAIMAGGFVLMACVLAAIYAQLARRGGGGERPAA